MDPGGWTGTPPTRSDPHTLRFPSMGANQRICCLSCGCGNSCKISAVLLPSGRLQFQIQISVDKSDPAIKETEGIFGVLTHYQLK